MALPYEFKASTIVKQGRTTQQAIDEIQNWVPTEEKIPRIPDELVVLFLISCENNIEATKNTIKAYFRIKSEAPDIFNDRDVDSKDLQKATNTM